MSRNLLLAAGVAVAATAFFAVWRWTVMGGEDAALSSPRADNPSRVDLPEAALAAVNDRAGVDSVTRVDQVEMAPAALREPARAARRTEREDDAPALRVQVVHADVGLPVAGADVFTWALAADESALTAVSRLATSGRSSHRTARSDASGFAPVERPGPRFLIAARKDALFGTFLVGGEPESATEPVIHVAAGASLRVRAVHSTGMPVAGITVELRHPPYDDDSMVSAATTDESGLVSFPHVTALRFGEHADAVWSAGLRMVAQERAAARFELADPPSEPIELSVPTRGSVEVAAFDVDGRRFDGDATVALGVVPEGGARTQSLFNRDGREHVQLALHAGRAVFEHVEIGQELEVGVQRSGGAVTTRQYAPGPTREGERARIEVHLGATHPVLRIRALHEDGAPYANASLRVRLDLSHVYVASQEWATVRTDTEGRFDFDLRESWTPGTERRIVVTPDADSKLSGELDLSREFPPGLFEVGDLALGPRALFVGGRVVDDMGRAIPDAELYLRCSVEDAKTLRWRSVPNFHYRSDLAGCFEVRGHIPGELFELGAVADGLAGPPVPVSRGASDVVVVLALEGVLEGQLLADPGVPVSVLTARLSGEGAVRASIRHGTQLAKLEPSGRFRFAGLLPGSYHVSIPCDDVDPLLDVREVVIDAGRVTDDPRLEVDLRGKLFCFELEIVTAKPLPHLRGNAFVRASGTSGDRKTKDLSGSEPTVTFVSRHPALDVILAEPGFRQVELPELRRRQVVELRDGIPVRLRLASHVPLPAPPVFIKAVLAPEDHGAGLDWGVDAFDERRQIVTTAPAAGRMQVHWMVELQAGPSAMGMVARMEPPQFVEVADVSYPQTIEVSLTDEQLEEMVGRLPR